MEQLLLKLITGNPEDFVEIARTYIKKYKPAVYEICKEVLDVAKDFAENKEVCEIAATRKKNLFDAYVKVGFTEEQAIAFIINDNLQLVKNMEKISSNSSKNTTQK